MAEHLTVDQVVVGSSPIAHPRFFHAFCFEHLDPRFPLWGFLNHPIQEGLTSELSK